MKQIICEFGTAKDIPSFDSCLCTHVAVPVSLESEKDDETLGKYNNHRLCDIRMNHLFVITSSVLCTYKTSRRR